MRHVLAYWRTILWSGFILYMSLLKEYNLHLLPDFSWRDKMFHAGAYCIMGLLLGIELKKEGINGNRYYLNLLLIPTLFGGMIEILQEYYFAPRVGDWFDFAANTLGVLIALLTCKIFVMK